MILLAPHNDDETLFASYLINLYRPFVIVVLRSYVQEDRGGTTYLEREQETEAACREHQVEWEQWHYDDRAPDWQAVREQIEYVAHGMHTGEPVLAPAPAWRLNDHTEEDSPAGFGALHHDWVGQLALDVFGTQRVIGYTTYTRTGGRTLGELIVPSPQAVRAKLRALACYWSQIEDPGCRPHFTGGLDEYITAT